MTSPKQSRGPGGLNRREFVALSGAGTMFPASCTASDAPQPEEAAVPGAPDVVIVGAGAAGIAAAHQLRDSGLSHVVIEASGRVGGRAFTETASFGLPHDVGAHWVQNGRRNPYFKMAKASGRRFYRAPDNWKIYERDGPADPAGEAALWAVWDRAEAAMARAGENGQDIAPDAVIPKKDRWASTAAFGIGPWEMGKDMTDFSCLDWYESADSTDYYFADGYGALVAAHARGLPVRLGTPATRIRWGGPGVEVETPDGTIKARAVIVTVSTGVLAGGGITFDPPLPVEKQEAFDAIPMGDYNHITLKFREDIFGLGEDGFVLHHVGQSNEAFGALTNAHGTGLAYCDVGGSFARDLERAGTKAATDFVVSTLRGMIGKDVDRYMAGSAVSAWRADPLVRGCYASARPGSTALRWALRSPVADRVFFAGEACHEDMWATVGGAHLSGRQTARSVARKLA